MNYEDEISRLRKKIQEQDRYIKYLECKEYCRQYEKEEEDNLPF